MRSKPDPVDQPERTAHYEKVKKVKALALGIAPLTEAQRRFTTVEVVSDWHWL